MKICSYLFERVEINSVGDVHFCCQERLAKHSLGNVFEMDFDKIWNSEVAIQMRENALKGNYPFCNVDKCGGFCFCDKDNVNYIEPTLKHVSLELDEVCNARCIFCRDENRTTNEETLEDIRNKIKSVYLPMCKNVETIQLNTSGDVFASKFCHEFLKLISCKYPNIKYIILTNGIAATVENINNLGLTEKMSELLISINSTNPKTHKLIFRNNGYKKLLENLTYIKKLKKENKIETLTFIFVVCKYNWKEMKSFIKFSKRYGAKCLFWEVRDYNNDSLAHKYEDIAVHIPSSPYYDKLKKYLTSKDFESENVDLYPVLKKMREEALAEKRKGLFSRFF